MLTIRLQRGGRSGHPQYRVVVQDSRFAPTSGRIVAQLGSYNPHTKDTIIDKVLAEKYLGNGAQPSERVVAILSTEGVTMPAWVKSSRKRSSTTRNVGKLRRNTPAEPEAEAPVEAVETEEAVAVAEETAPADTEETTVEA